MPSNSIEKVKKAKDNYVKKVNDFKNGLNKHKSKAKYDNQQTSASDKVKGIEYYNSLSEGEKKAFQEELKKREIRENYHLYLKYIYGDNFKLTRFHSFLARLCDNVVKRIEKGENIYICLSVPPQHGKGYPVDYPVLTTKGWKRHGDLKYGDYVYNDKGEQVMVLANQDPYIHSCLEIIFANGEKHIITREHLWKVCLEKENRINGKHHNIRYETIMETQDLMKILPKCRRSPYVLMNKPLQNDYKELPIDPYVFGLWLGDGESARNISIVDEKDLPDELNAIGDRENYIVYKDKRNPKLSYIKYGKEIPNWEKGFKYDFTKKLKELNVLNNKHIPTIYLIASEEQRWQLLRGLMDTDGCCDIRGNCEFCNTNKELAYNTYTLLHSLGIKARINEYDAKLYGRFISKKYRIIFNPNKTDHIFNIERKQNRIINKTKKDRDDKYKYFIKSIKEVGSTLVSCISVEGGMYLAGKDLIPTHNSTVMTQTLPSWFLGRNPDLRCITTAYNADIAEKFGDEPRQQIKKYGKDIFGIEISDSQDNKTIWNIKDHMGGLYATGINGSLTSNQGALIIVDDPIKNEIEANNPTIRDTIWANFSTSLWTRQRAKGCAIIVIQTRWHEDDLIGRIMTNDEDNKWVYINLPCVWESGIDKILGRKIGETLCPELGFTAEWAKTTKKLLGTTRWNALYQGKPVAEGGEIIKRDMLNFYNKKTLPSVFEELTISCDPSLGTTNKSSDANGICVWGKIGGDHYMLNPINKPMTFSQALEHLRYLCGLYPMARAKIIEARANGNAIIETLNREIGGFIPFEPHGVSKEARLQLCLPYFEAGNIHIPDESVYSDSEEIVNQLIKFPKYKHDEIVDITTQYLLNYQYKYSGRINTDDKYSKLAKAIRGLRI